MWPVFCLTAKQEAELIILRYNQSTEGRATIPGSEKQNSAVCRNHTRALMHVGIRATKVEASLGPDGGDVAIVWASRKRESKPTILEHVSWPSTVYPPRSVPKKQVVFLQ